MSEDRLKSVAGDETSPPQRGDGVPPPAGQPAPPDGTMAADDPEAIRAINQRIFETSLDLILVVDRRGSFMRVSPSSLAILGYRPDEMVGRSAADFLLPADLENTRDEMRLARRGRSMRNFECRYMHKNGHIVPLTWTGVWSEPEQQHFFIGRDMTERIAAAERTAHSQRLEAVGQLTGGMAHDFNNLLGVIIGNLELLRDRVRSDDEAQSLSEEALDAAMRGADLTRRLLAFARRQPLQPVLVDLNELIQGITKLLSRTLGEQIEMRLDLARDLWRVVVDPVQLESAITNLAMNARDAMPRGGRLTFTTANSYLDEEYAAQQTDVTAGDYIVISITDTGTGMAPEVQQRAFEPFFTTKEPGKGTGLGLSMVFGFMKQSGGHINVYSEPGVGTTFRLYLRPAEGSEIMHTAEASPSHIEHGGETILLVEDSSSLRRVVSRQLTELGYRLLEAAAAAAALEILGSGAPVDLLMTDIVMPGGVDGLDLAREAMTRRPGIKILLTSGFPEDRLDREIGSLRQLRLLSKPYRRRDLARTVREVLDGETNERRNGDAGTGC